MTFNSTHETFLAKTKNLSKGLYLIEFLWRSPASFFVQEVTQINDTTVELEGILWVDSQPTKGTYWINYNSTEVMLLKKHRETISTFSPSLTTTTKSFFIPIGQLKNLTLERYEEETLPAPQQGLYR